MTSEEYYAELKERHEQTDWNNLDSIKAYNQYARSLRQQMAAEREAAEYAERIKGQ